MNLKDILVFLHAGSASEARLKLATNIARDHGAHLAAVYLPLDEKATLQPSIGASLPGWSANGSREAVRALNDALPLIGNAEAVTVMTVRERERDFEHDRPSMERVICHLARHGVAARPDRVLHGGSPVSDVLLSRAADIAADLIVAGAYHHSQMREALIGGVSRGLFRQVTVPVLMSH
jgi:nucleotide-binding universal stress UspA family protein